jgi:hypothetical protein
LNREARTVTLSDVTNQAAYLLRENTETSGVMRTAQMETWDALQAES